MPMAQRDAWSYRSLLICKQYSQGCLSGHRGTPLLLLAMRGRHHRAQVDAVWNVTTDILRCALAQQQQRPGIGHQANTTASGAAAAAASDSGAAAAPGAGGASTAGPSSIPAPPLPVPRNYLLQHATGSGKSLTVAGLVDHLVNLTTAPGGAVGADGRVGGSVGGGSVLGRWILWVGG